MGLLISRFAEIMNLVIEQKNNYAFEILEISTKSLNDLIQNLTSVNFKINLTNIHFIIALLYIAQITKISIVEPLLSK